MTTMPDAPAQTAPTDIAERAYPQEPGPQNAVEPIATGYDDEQTANYVRQMFYRARDARRPLVREWKQNYRTLNNRSWRQGSDSWVPSPSIPQIWPVVFSSVAWLTDQRPIVEVAPVMQPFSAYADFYQSLAQDMNTCLESTFRAHFVSQEITKMMWDVYTYRIGYLKTNWEAWLADGLGDTVPRRVDPFTVYPDPFARSMNDLTYIIEAKIMTVQDVDRAWPGAGKRIQGGFLEAVDDSPHRLDETINTSQPRAAFGNLPQSTATRYGISDRDRMAQVREVPVVTVLECWVRDHVTSDTDSDKVKKVNDTWRCIVVCGNVVLMDAPAETVNAYGSHPYSRCVLVDTGEWYGVSMVQMLESAQESIMRTLQSIEQNIALMGDPMLVESQRSPSKNKRLVNRPGARIPVNTPADVAWLAPPQMQPQIAVELMQFYKGEIESVSGLSAMVRGFSPSGRNAQGVLDTVQDAAFVRVRATLREIETCLNDVATKMSANIAEFYTEPRFMALMGADGQRTHLALRARHFYARDAENEDDRIPLRFTLVADAGSQLPTSKQARAGEAKQLFALGAIDVFELLKAMQWPNFSIVAKRVMDQQAAAGALGQPPGKRQATRS